eukprot:6654816-Pyramimonas_sp.AAC.1
MRGRKRKRRRRKRKWDSAGVRRGQPRRRFRVIRPRGASRPCCSCAVFSLCARGCVRVAVGLRRTMRRNARMRRMTDEDEE